MKFIRLREMNDWEGELWNFWLQLDGNEDELAKLESLLAEQRRLGYDLPYHLHLTFPVPEDEIDALVEVAEDYGGYYPRDMKVTGKFTCPDEIGEEGDALYKGGIFRYFK